MPRSTKVVVAPRAPASSTGTLANSLPTNSWAFCSEPYFLAANPQAAR